MLPARGFTLPEPDRSNPLVPVGLETIRDLGLRLPPVGGRIPSTGFVVRGGTPELEDLNIPESRLAMGVGSSLAPGLAR